MAAQQFLGSSGTLVWNGGGGSSSTSAEYENRHFESQEEDDIAQYANNRIRLTPKNSNEQVRMAQVLLNMRPLGLKLSLTPPNLELLAKRPKQVKPDDVGPQSISEKLKASNFPARSIDIGDWKRTSRNEGDLVAKCYYAKKKLVWEFLEGGLKRKIELQWSDISAIRAVIQENQPGTLEIELSQPPTFHMEIDPQPRKHTIWKLTTDFTDGNATLFRRHFLVFPPGSLDKHYEKLLQCDPRLLGLSQRPFPSRQSPVFVRSDYEQSNFSFSFPVFQPHINRGFQFAPSSIPSPLVTAQPILSYEHLGQHYSHETPSPISVMDFSPPDEHVSKAFWCQGTGGYARTLSRDQAHGLVTVASRTQVSEDALARSQVHGLVSVVSPNQVDAVVSMQSSNVAAACSRGGSEGGGCSNLDGQFLSNIARQLLSDSDVGHNYNENYHMERVASFGALMNLSMDNVSGSKNDSDHTTYGQDSSSPDNGLVLRPNDFPAGMEEPLYHQQLQVSSMPSQLVCTEHPLMPQDSSNMSYAADIPHLTDTTDVSAVKRG